ncbi:MAG TPA: hypothetical protein VLV89_01420, partial [Candidatus Acidoferrum sp.]|nr:hypothetical protein [Candidatus Acidoferrum sp.]
MKPDKWGSATIVAGLLVVGLSFTVTAAAKLQTKDAPKDPPWVAKDWTQWTEDDCKAVLEHSPWGRDLPAHEFGEQLRSALPIRQALLRKAQLDEFYDRMKPDKKLAFDQAHAHDLDPSDCVVIDIWNGGSESLRYIPPTYSEGNAYYEFPPLNPYTYSAAFPVRQVVLRLADGTLIQPTGGIVV